MGHSFYALKSVHETVNQPKILSALFKVDLGNNLWTKFCEILVVGNVSLSVSFSLFHGLFSVYNRWSFRPVLAIC